MRSLSLESIPVNNNMKVLILLVALFVQTNPSLSRPTPDLKSIFSEVLDSLLELKDHDLKESKQVRLTPHDINNACECVTPFVHHLKKALQSVNSALNKDQIYIDAVDNILDNIDTLPLDKIPHGNCKSTKHPIKHEELSNDWIESYITFIQRWNAHC